MIEWCKENLNRDEKNQVKRLSSAERKRAVSPFGNRRIPIVVFDLFGNRVGSHDSILATARALNIDHQTIRYCLNSGCAYKKKWYFSKSGEFDYVESKKEAPEYTGWNDKPVYQFCIDGTFFKEHRSVVAAAVDVGLKRHSIDSAIRRVSVVLGKWYFSTTKEFKLPAARKYNRNPLARPTQL